MDGLDKSFPIPLTHRDRLRIRCKSTPDKRPTFAVMLECWWIEEKWIQVARIDDWHDCPHIDRPSIDGGMETKEWLADLGDNKANLDAAIKRLVGTFEQERAAYETRFKPPASE